HLLFAREMPPRQVEQRARLLLHLVERGDAEERTDPAIHLLVLVAKAAQRSERARRLLVGLEERLLFDARVPEQRERQGLDGDAQLAERLAAVDRVVELLDEQVEHAVLARENVRHVHAAAPTTPVHTTSWLKELLGAAADAPAGVLEPGRVLLQERHA